MSFELLLLAAVIGVIGNRATKAIREVATELRSQGNRHAVERAAERTAAHVRAIAEPRKH